MRILFYHRSPKNVISWDRITLKEGMKQNNTTKTHYVEVISIILLGIPNTIYQEIPSCVCSQCEGHAEIVKFFNIV